MNRTLTAPTKPTTRRRKSPLATEGAAVPIPRKVTETHWQIDSWTQTLVTYDVRFVYQQSGIRLWECSCAWYAFHHDCKHLRSLEYWLQEQALVEAVSASYARYTAETEVTLESIFQLPPSPQEVQEARRLERVGRRERVKEAW